jgi:hypothetical protein
MFCRPRYVGLIGLLNIFWDEGRILTSRGLQYELYETENINFLSCSVGYEWPVMVPTGQMADVRVATNT